MDHLDYVCQVLSMYYIHAKVDYKFIYRLSCKMFIQPLWHTMAWGSGLNSECSGKCVHIIHLLYMVSKESAFLICIIDLCLSEGLWVGISYAIPECIIMELSWGVANRAWKWGQEKHWSPYVQPTLLPEPLLMFMWLHLYFRNWLSFACYWSAQTSSTL